MCIVLEAPLLQSVTNSEPKASQCFISKQTARLLLETPSSDPVTSLPFLSYCSDMLKQAPSHAATPLPQTSRRRLRIHSWSFCCPCWLHGLWFQSLRQRSAGFLAAMNSPFSTLQSVDLIMPWVASLPSLLLPKQTSGEWDCS